MTESTQPADLSKSAPAVDTSDIVERLPELPRPHSPGDEFNPLDIFTADQMRAYAAEAVRAALAEAAPVAASPDELAGLRLRAGTAAQAGGVSHDHARKDA